MNGVFIHVVNLEVISFCLYDIPFGGRRSYTKYYPSNGGRYGGNRTGLSPFTSSEITVSMFA